MPMLARATDAVGPMNSGASAANASSSQSEARGAWSQRSSAASSPAAKRDLQTGEDEQVIRPAAAEALAHLVGEHLAAPEHQRLRQRDFVAMRGGMTSQSIRERAVPGLRMPARQVALVRHQLRAI